MFQLLVWFSIQLVKEIMLEPAGDKGQKRDTNVNVKDAKPDREGDSWNCGSNHFARDCTKPAKKDDDKKGKVDVTFQDDYDDDYGDGASFSVFGSRFRN